MKTRILILITVMAVVTVGNIKEATAQGKVIYFMKDGKVTYSSEIANIDSIIFAPPILPTLSIEPSALSFTMEGTESYDVVVTTNQQSWDATSNQTWCTITKGTDQFTVETAANTGTNRTATITVAAGKATPKTISVTQAGINLANEISMSLNGIAWLGIGNTFIGGRILNVRNYSGELSLRIEAGGKSHSRTIEVQANSRYSLTVTVTGYTTSFGTSLLHTFPVSITSGSILLRKDNVSYFAPSAYIDSVNIGDPVLIE